jgi:hypothetical protein
VRVTVDGAPITHWDELSQALRSSEPKLAALLDRGDVKIVRSFLSKRVIAAGSDFHPISIVGLTEEERQLLPKWLQRVQFQLCCYCSTLDECWMVREFQSLPVRACPLDELTFAE